MWVHARGSLPTTSRHRPRAPPHRAGRQRRRGRSCEAQSHRLPGPDGSLRPLSHRDRLLIRLQRHVQLVCGREPSLGSFLKAPGHNLDEATRKARVEAPQRFGLIHRESQQQRGHGLASKRLDTAHRPIEHHPHRPDICPGIDVCGPRRLFGRHVLRRPHDDVRPSATSPRFLGELRDPEIHEFDQHSARFRLMEEHILRFEIAVDNTRSVGRREAFEGLPNDQNCELGVDASLGLEQLGEALSDEHLHHDVGPQRRLPQIEDVANMWVSDPPSGGRLVLKTVQRPRVPSVLGVHDLDGDVLPNPEVFGHPNRAHATLSKLPNEAEAVVEQPPRQREQPAGGRADQHRLGVDGPAVRTGLLRLPGVAHGGARYNTPHPVLLRGPKDLPRCLRNVPGVPPSVAHVQNTCRWRARRSGSTPVVPVA